MFSLKPVRLSNRRPVSQQPDFKTLSTKGAMQLSEEWLRANGYATGTPILVEVFPTSIGANPTRENTSEVFVLTEGVEGVGNRVTNQNNKYVVSSQKIWEDLGGNTEMLQIFDVSAPYYGVGVKGETAELISIETEGSFDQLWAYVSSGDNVEFAQVEATLEDVKKGQPFFTLTFTEETQKQEKGEAGTKTKNKKEKVVAETEVDLNDFE